MATTAREVIGHLDAFAPPRLAVAGDPAGLAAGDPDRTVTAVYFAMDAGFAALEGAAAAGAELIACHHPRIFRPLASLAPRDFAGRLAGALLRSGIAVYSAHTALDLAPGGVADSLARAAGLGEGGREVETFAVAVREPYLKLAVFVPAPRLEAVREAIAAAGAGALGNYSACSFRVAGTGTFLPMEGARPHLGRVGVPEEVAEWRLEAILPRHLKGAAEKALRAAHPYEEPAFDFYTLDQGKDYGFGRAGGLPRPPTLAEWAERLKQATGSTETRILGDPGRRVERAGVLGGAASGFPYEAARELRLDAVAVGEMGYHDQEVFAATGAGLVLLGHGWSERPGLAAWAEHLRRAAPELRVVLEPPPPGAVNC